MKNKRFQLENIIIAALVILVFTKVKLLNYINYSSGLQSLVIISFFVSSVVGIVGIFLQKYWGYFSIYIFILISSVFLGIAPIPFIEKLFPINSTFLVILTSTILFLFTLFLQLNISNNINQKTT